MIHRLFFAYVLYPIAERLTGRDIRSKLRVMEAHMALPFRERKLIAQRRLASMLRYAGEHTPYYRDLFARLEFDPAEVERDPECLRRLPYLTKEIIRAQGTRMLSDEVEEKSLHLRKTGGSTGPSALIRYSQEALDWTAAANLMVVGWTGKKRYWKEAHLATRPVEKYPIRDRLKEAVKCMAMNRVNFFTDALDEHGLEKLWQGIRKSRPHLIQGHPSTMYALARRMEAAGYDGERAFTIFESTGELLDKKKRRFIDNVLGCRTVNRYGLAEFGVAAYERSPSDLDKLLVLDYMVWPETLPSDHGRNEIALTGLTNRAMPLIRYRAGDLADLIEDEDGWYFTDPVGRVHELVTIGGRLYPTHYLQDFLDRIPGIADFQIRERDGRVPLLRLSLEKDASSEEIGNRVHAQWGDSLDVAFIPLEELERLGRRAKFSRLIRDSNRSDSEKAGA